MQSAIRTRQGPTWSLLLGACLAATSGCEKAAAPTPAPRASPPNFNPGVAIGEPAPDFQLADQHGEQHSLTDLVAAGNVALVFFRSADW